MDFPCLAAKQFYLDSGCPAPYENTLRFLSWLTVSRFRMSFYVDARCIIQSVQRLTIYNASLAARQFYMFRGETVPHDIMKISL